MSTTPRIYVACLASYNAGTLHGAWIDATQSADDIHAEITEMLAASPEPGAEEFAIHDYEGFGEIRLGEYESIEHVAELGVAIAANPAFSAYAAHVGDDCADISGFEDAYCGEWEDFEDYVDDLVEQTGMLDGLDESLVAYFNYDAYARDLLLGGDYFTAPAPGSNVYVFRGC